jgi:hypothetical protein
MCVSHCCALQIQRDVDNGLYRDRGLQSGDTIGINADSVGLRFLSLDSEGGWHFENIVVMPSYPGKPERVLQGGAECTLTINDVNQIMQSADQALSIRYPYFADWKVPYYLALLAPIALLIDRASYALSHLL